MSDAVLDGVIVVLDAILVVVVVGDFVFFSRDAKSARGLWSGRFFKSVGCLCRSTGAKLVVVVVVWEMIRLALFCNRASRAARSSQGFMMIEACALVVTCCCVREDST